MTLGAGSIYHFREKRRHIRKIGEGLVVVIGARVFPLLDISVAGVSFQATGYKVGDTVSLSIAQSADMTKAVDGRITVVAAGGTIVRGRFYPTMRLMRFIIRHFSDAAGIAPRYFV